MSLERRRMPAAATQTDMAAMYLGMTMASAPT